MTAAATLKNRQRNLRDGQPEALRTRIHRALSWLGRAERETDDPDARFLFLWIAFNAAYASEFGFERTEREQARRFWRARFWTRFQQWRPRQCRRRPSGLSRPAR